jgi:hypothetical protein
MYSMQKPCAKPPHVVQPRHQSLDDTSVGGVRIGHEPMLSPYRCEGENPSLAVLLPGLGAVSTTLIAEST